MVASRSWMGLIGGCILKVSRGFKGATRGCIGLMEADDMTVGGGYLTRYGVERMLYVG